MITTSNGNIISKGGRISRVSSVLTGLISYWNLNETGANIFVDSVNSSITAVAGGTASNGSVGRIGYCAKFDGDASGSIPLPTTYLSGKITTAISISCWIKLNRLSSVLGYDARFVNLMKSGGSRNIFINQDSATNRIRFTAVVLNGSYSTDYTYSSVIITLGEWVHIVAVAPGAGSNYKIYINGIDDTQRVYTQANTLNNITSVNCLGNSYASDNFCMDGYLDEVAIWDRALTQTEITWLYNWRNNLLN